jgi:hypothetical protein
MKSTKIGTITISPFFNCRTGSFFEDELDLSKFRAEELGTPRQPPAGTAECAEIVVGEEPR